MPALDKEARIRAAHDARESDKACLRGENEPAFSIPRIRSLSSNMVTEICGCTAPLNLAIQRESKGRQKGKQLAPLVLSLCLGTRNCHLPHTGRLYGPESAKHSLPLGRGEDARCEEEKRPSSR